MQCKQQAQRCIIIELCISVVLVKCGLYRTTEKIMYNILYIIGAVVVVIAILRLAGII